MHGLVRELIKGGKYVVASIDYRWIGQRGVLFVYNRQAKEDTP